MLTIGVPGPESGWNGMPYRGEADESIGVCCPVFQDRTLERDPAAPSSTRVWDSERPAMEGGQPGDTKSSA